MPRLYIPPSRPPSSIVSNVLGLALETKFPRRVFREKGGGGQRNEAIKQSAGRAAVHLPPAIGAAGPEGDPGQR